MRQVFHCVKPLFNALPYIRSFATGGLWPDPNFEISGVLSRFLIHPWQDAAPWRYLVFRLCCSLRGNLALAGLFVGIVADRVR